MEVITNQSLTIKRGKYTLTGLVLDQSGNPAAGLKVHAVDQDQIGKHDHLGSTITTKAGTFKISFKRADYEDLFEGKGPDLYFRVYHQGKVILDTEFQTIQEADENIPPIVLKVDLPMKEAPTEGTVNPTGNLQQGTISWEKISGVAQFKVASWENEVSRQHGVSPEEAKIFAESNAEITYFIHFNKPAFLEGKAGADGYTEKGQFFVDDVIYFSGKPQYGSAGQADAYEKRRIVWKKKTSVAQFGGADWSHEFMRLHQTSLETAKTIAANVPEITYFFRTHSTMWLQGKSGPGGYTEKGHFHDGEVVFFTGKPHYGSAPQSNAYEKLSEPLWKK